LGWRGGRKSGENTPDCRTGWCDNLLA
jgi:hypothetical protein